MSKAKTIHIGGETFETVREAADRLRVSTSTVREWIISGRLPCFRLGPRSIRLKTSDVDALLKPIPTGREAS